MSNAEKVVLAHEMSALKPQVRISSGHARQNQPLFRDRKHMPMEKLQSKHL